MTRAKAATLNVDELAMPTKALQSKKTAINANPTRATRSALGDVSNMGKVKAAEAKSKPLAKVAPVSKAGPVSKAAQPTGIQKKPTTSRAPLATKETSKKPEPKRSGPGSIGSQKRKAMNPLSSNAATKDHTREDGEPTRKRLLKAVDDEKKADVKQVGASRKESAPAPAPMPVVSEPVERYIPQTAVVLDLEDIDDPLMVAEYANDIFEYLRDLECKSIPNPQYMSHQDDLEWKTRGILIDWLVEVHTRFHLLPETLFLAVNVVDRFLSEKVVQLDRLQLVGITAMFIASKYEEVLSPHIANFRHIADDGFTEAEILSAERFVLATLNYDLSYPNPMNFLRRISKADNYDIQSRTIGKYLMEISLLDHRLMAHRPSHIAAAAMYLSRLILDRGEWVRQCLIQCYQFPPG